MGRNQEEGVVLPEKQGIPRPVSRFSRNSKTPEFRVF